MRGRHSFLRSAITTTRIIFFGIAPLHSAISIVCLVIRSVPSIRLFRAGLSIGYEKEVISAYCNLLSLYRL